MICLASRRYLSAGVLAVLVWLAAPLSLAQPTPPTLTAPVNDYAHVIDAGSAAEIDRMIRALQQATGDVVVVVTVDTVAPFADIREYAVKLFANEGRGIGQRGKDNGLLVLVAVNDRRVWIEVGYGLEEYITDGFAGETSRQYMAPAFRTGDYGAGLKAGVSRIVGRIAQARGVSIQGVPQPQGPEAQPLSTGIIILYIFLFMVVLLIIAWAQSKSRSMGPRSGGWGGGSWSGWSSGIGSFGTGGFGGGGGGFGGGFGGFGGGRSGGGGGGSGW